MPFMYILECGDGTYYTGSTPDVEKRLEEHDAGFGANYTAKRLPVKLVYTERFLMIKDAFEREKQIQKWSQAKKKALIAGDIETLKLASKKGFKKPSDM